MRKLIYSLVFVTLFVSLANAAAAGPAPLGIALDQEQKLCGGYWGGDEFIRYQLPDGWKAFYPESYEYVKTGTCVAGGEICAGKYQIKINRWIEPLCLDTMELCEQYISKDGYLAINTDAGTCFVHSPESCCAQLGYTYTNYNVGEEDKDANVVKRENYTTDGVIGSVVADNTNVIIYILLGIVFLLLVLVILLLIRRRRTNTNIKI